MSENNVLVVAILTTGRLAPCFSAAVGFLLKVYRDVADPTPIVLCYRNGFRGMLTGDVVRVMDAEFAAADRLIERGGSPIGGSAVRLENRHHLLLRELVTQKEDPYHKCAVQIMKDGVDVLHIIGSANAHREGRIVAHLASRLRGKLVRSIGLAKTTENDVQPIFQSLGSLTAAKEGARYFLNVVAEHQANPRMLILYVIKGFGSGWLCAATALEYRRLLARHEFAPTLGLSRDAHDIHAVYTPEMSIDLDSDVTRLRRCMDRHGNVNIFVSEATFQEDIVLEARRRGTVLRRHPVLNHEIVDVGAFLKSRLHKALGAEKVLVQRGGVYARAAPPCEEDVRLTQTCASMVVQLALSEESRSGVVGHDTRNGNRLGLVPWDSIRGERPLDLLEPWCSKLLGDIGQPLLMGHRKSYL